MIERIERALLVVLAGLGGLIGHHGGDYLVQDDCMAASKQRRDAHGRTELALHASTYAATQAVTRALLYRLAGLRVPVVAQLATAAVEGLLHGVIDDGRLLARFSRLPSRRIDDDGRWMPLGVYENGTWCSLPRPVAGRQQRFHDEAPGGRALMDQAMHHQVQIPIGVAVTVAVTALVRRTRRTR